MRGPLLLVAGVVAGILAGDRGGPGDGRAGLLVAVVAGAVLVGRRHGTVAALALVMLGAGVGSAVEQRALHGAAHSPLSGPTARGATGAAVLTLREDPDGPFFGVEALATVERFAGRSAGGRTVLIRAGDTAASELRPLGLGDRLRVTGRLGPLTGWNERLHWRHAVAVLTLDDVRAVAGPRSGWLRVANGLRARVVAGANVLAPESRALLVGFLLGDTRDVAPRTVAEFRASGLSHVLAVSGANVAFVLALAGPVLRRLPLRLRLGSGLAVVVVFAAMTRFEPSVLRASVMAGFALLARFAGRPADAPRVLTLAAIALLVVDPFLLHSVGFLLSCGACAGIVVLGGRITGAIPGPRVVAETLGVTVAAQLGVAPFLFAVFGSIPAVTPLANLLAGPFVGPLTMWGLAASVVGGLVGPGVAFYLQLPTDAMVRVVALVASVSARSPVTIGAAPFAGATAAGFALVGVRRWLGHARVRGRSSSSRGSPRTGGRGGSRRCDPA